MAVNTYFRKGNSPLCGIPMFSCLWTGVFPHNEGLNQKRIPDLNNEGLNQERIPDHTNELKARTKEKQWTVETKGKQWTVALSD
ncbi:unnamed protein product [Rodentolepis nana]|uniref:Uncharacterized protein n=1 Tax=Rodentolepis nana TaxID=102285 RepID=A0A0R3U033_RODNA|nr:unnamed protein product [Rodentolepis nana]